MSLAKSLTLVCLALCTASAGAVPAPWFKWHSPEADNEICAQFSPGQGWVIFKGPFQDAHCSKPGVPS